jgi:hypothetical protein
MKDKDRVIAYLKQIGFKVDPDDFDNRLIIQKIATYAVGNLSSRTGGNISG